MSFYNIYPYIRISLMLCGHRSLNVRPMKRSAEKRALNINELVTASKFTPIPLPIYMDRGSMQCLCDGIIIFVSRPKDSAFAVNYSISVKGELYLCLVRVFWGGFGDFLFKYSIECNGFIKSCSLRFSYSWIRCYS